MADIVLRTSGGAELAVREGDLFFPYRGTWTAHVTLAEAPDELPSGRCTLRWHGLDCAGYLLRIGTAEGETSALVVGGAGGLARTVDAKYYANQPQLRLPASEVLSAVGERLSASSTASVLSQVLPSWPRRRDLAGRLLDDLADAAGAIWRVLPDGSIWIGTDSWVPGGGQEDLDFTLRHSDPEWLVQEIAPLTPAGFPRCGETFSPAGLGGKVARVHLEDDGETYVARVWYLSAGADDDPLVAGIRGIVREELSRAAAYPQFSGQVVQQRADGTLDVQMDDRRIPPLTSVPLLVPVPGGALEVAAGARCRVAFASGDLRQPAVQLYETGSGSKAFGIDGDEVDLGQLSVQIASGGVVAILWTSPFGGAPVTIATAPATTPLKGKLKGSAKLKHP